MRCVCCNRNLNDYESTLRHAEYGHFLDTCNKCLNGLGIPVVGRDDLSETASIEDEEFEYDHEDDDE